MCESISLIRIIGIKEKIEIWKWALNIIHFILKTVAFATILVSYQKKMKQKVERNDETHQYYKKPKVRLLYVHSLSNHSPNVIKHIPNSIQKRLLRNSSNEKLFNAARFEYEEARKKVGSNLILNTRKINNKNQKLELEILFGSIHHLTSISCDNNRYAF